MGFYLYFVEKFYLLDAAQRLFYDLPPSAPVMEGAASLSTRNMKNSKKKRAHMQDFLIECLLLKKPVVNT